MNTSRPKLLRITTVPISQNVLLKGQHRFMSEHGFEVIAISSGGKELDEVAEREGIITIALEMTRTISPLKDLMSLWKLYRLCKKEKPDIVHSITPKAGLLAMIAGKLAGIPIRLHTFTGLIFPTRTGYKQKLLIKMDQLLCWAATHIYPEGNGVKNDLNNYKITSKPLKVLANGNVNGINLDYFSPTQVSDSTKNQLKTELHISNDDFVFVFVGRLVGDKGINELVKAFQTITSLRQAQADSDIPRHTELVEVQAKTDDFRHLKLLLVGPLETELDPLLPETLEKLKTNPNIISVGFQKDVRPYFAISDCLVFPSYREGFPNVVMQAGAMGLPSIVSDINGCNEIIIEGLNGRIIPPKNVSQLISAIQRMMLDKENYQKLKSNSRQMIAERYEQTVVWNAILEEYNRLMRKG